MQRILVSLVALLALANAVAAAQQQPIVDVKIPVRHLKASEFAYLLKTSTTDGGTETQVRPEKPLLPFGIVRIVPQDQDNTLLIRGTEEAIAKTREIIRTLDVQPRLVMVKMRLIRARLTPSGRWEETILGTPILSTINNATGRIGITGGNGYSIRVKPRIQEDNSITLQVQWGMTGADENIHHFVQGTERVPAGHTLRLGLTDSKALEVRTATRMTLFKGQAPFDKVNPKAPVTLFYLEMTPGEIVHEQSSSTP